MKYRITFWGLVLAVLVPLALVSQDTTEPDRTEVVPARRLSVDDKLDKKVVEIVKQTGDLYKNAKSWHVEGLFETKMDRGGLKRNIKATGTYDVEKPDRLSMRTVVDGDAKKGPDIIADAKNVIIYRKALGQYTEQEAPKDLGEIGMQTLQLGPANMGMLFANILADDPANLLMQGVTECSYAGLDKMDGKPVHRLKFTQNEFDWELWVASEGKPYILRMITISERDGGKDVTTETYKNWKLDEKPAKDLFKFTPPKGVIQVESFTEPSR